MGKSQLLNDEEIWSVCNRISLEPSTSINQFSYSLIRGLVEQRGEAWVESILSHPVYLSWSATHRAEFYLCLDFDEQTWERLDSEPEDVKKHYWSKAGSYGFNLTEQTLEKAAQNLLLAGRPYEVIFLLGQYRYNHLPVRSALVEEALEMALQTPPPDTLHVSMFSHHVRELMNGLETAGKIENDKMARLEWGYQPFLKYQRTPKLLHELMGKDPAFFLEILSFMYTSNKEERTSLPTPEEKDRAHRAYQLFESWRRIPGSQEDGSIDFPALKSWTEQVRELGTLKGMLSSVDGQVGHLLAHSPRGEDNIWPASAVRNLLEVIDSEEMSRGFVIQVYNNRGVVSKQHLARGKAGKIAF